MHIMLAWFAERALPEAARRAARDRFDASLAEVVPASFRRHEFGGEDWGVIVLHPHDSGAYRWSTVDLAGPVTAVSLGLPVGLDLTGGPTALAGRLLAGEDVHREVVPPFGLLALHAADGFALQQDWLGMCRVFTGTSGGVTAFCTRPSPLAAFLHGDVRPDPDGWRSYALCGHFGGDLSPIAGTRLLRPGERVTGRRRADGGWDLTTAIRYATDDVVTSGFAGRDGSLDDLLDGAADALTRTAASMHRLYADEIPLGLSGGKDSRLIAASLLAAGGTPRFVTNEDTGAEGEVARQLVQILRDKRGLNPEHELRLAGAPARVLGTGLRERTRRLQRLHDFQFPSSYVVRPAAATRLDERVRPATFTGAAGELATGYWYPPADAETASPEQAGLAKLLAAVPRAVAAEAAVAAEQDRIAALLRHARDIGLRDLHLLDHLYLVERMRRWCTSANATGMVTPFLAPGFVAATFGLTPEQKRGRLLHTGLIEWLVPEWAEVPFVSVSTGGSTATRVWEGDGIEVIADLLDTAHGPITEVIHRPAVEKTLRAAVKGGRADARTLQQFTWLALASHQLEAGATRPATAATYARITAPPRPPKPSPLVARLRWIKRTRLGNRIWAEVRNRVRR
ncbi:asparagine synthase (glutamine-hydrolysing) [Micromonospora rhizosphaerae]|uniref:Asparagine synthase (Glutamine-hydrolysing) n=1 Tax=Micromonospora rhizosphaerae TaxID=568872 RepID=A0A1C6RBE1_9ACTN|nr:hypothetical protein [Micromonospora rhizosphaerae]SCL14445.1 asparagine synthase (glutamine-hydrolysing) [Micromonospora rhizosphaerae]